MEALGPWGLGVKTAHFVLLLLCFRYNVTSGIARCGNHDFGHFWLYLVDQIQLRIQELYNVQVYPNHANMLPFDYEVDHVAVGIGPLSYLPEYVTSGPPHPLLKGDIKFLAERMHLTLPPLPISSSTEKKIFNELVALNPGPSARDFREWATIFLSKSDGKSIFPKLPCMLKCHYNKWKQNSLIILAETSMKDSYATILNDLACVMVSANDDINNGSPADEGYIDVSNSIEEVDNSPQTDVDSFTDVANDNPLNVGPLNTLIGTGYVTSNSRHEAQRKKLCFYHPFCTFMANVCGGHSRGRCNQVNSGAVVVPSIDVLNEEKRRSRNIRKSMQYMEKKRQKLEATAVEK